MHPVERLRSVIRWSGDEGALAVEAATALASLAGEPAGLVVACRRVLAHHPGVGPLWWVAARMLTAPDPRAASREAVRLLDSDETPERLAACLPLLDEPVAVVGWPAPIARALATRPDLAALAVRAEGTDPDGTLRRPEIRHDGPEPVEPRALRSSRVTLLLVAAAAAGAGRALVPRGTGDAIAAAGPRADVWLVAGVGRMLPDRLFAAAEAAAGRGSCDDPPLESLRLTAVDRVVGPRGAQAVDDAVRAGDCPVPPELLRPFGP